MRQILYIGKFFPRELRETVKEDSRFKIGLSNHNFEMSLIDGVAAQNDIKARFLSIPGVFSYPHNNKKFWTKSESYSDGAIEIVSVGFCNLTIVNVIWRLIAAFFKIMGLFRKIHDSKIEVIINTPSFDLLLPLLLAKYCTTKKVLVTLIVPDIPLFVSSMDKMRTIKKWGVGLIDKISMYLASKSNFLVLLTEQMMDFFPKNIPYIVMEGIVSLPSKECEKCGESEIKSILYSGTLRKIFGIMNLIDAFNKLSIPDVELWVCGSGEASKELYAFSKINPNIKFFGLLDSYETLRLQRAATVLVNPRTSLGEFTKYSFPSKNMEYLLSGNPVIAYKLPGIPEEYDEYLLYPDDESVDSLASKIQEILSLSKDKCKALGNRGRQFIINKKNSSIQIRRILDFIKPFNANEG